MLCPRCQLVWRAPPQRVFPRVDPHVPVFALAPYAGAHRSVILAMKERRNLAVRRYIGAVLDAALTALEDRGEIPRGTHLVPAPTRARAARLRGGDPVTALCRASTRKTYPVVTTVSAAADQGDLSAEDRRKNLAGKVRLSAVPPSPVVVVDDVVTTGATLSTTVERLIASQVTVVAAVALTYA